MSQKTCKFKARLGLCLLKGCNPLCEDDGLKQYSTNGFKLVSVGKSLCLSFCAMSCSKGSTWSQDFMEIWSLVIHNIGCG